ncbi:hypothetical protein B0J12DRAFT_335416 [Macrophomina phaseolina]|uniref:Uncharacterized protein n=1 Tax=Macrophomina phaseolina TaxID=35725 RepID=A0ABQ8GLE2_9PEZI|nr:hypothetical protein B0J12DRAFT_335416 [Macrophomina phaseolina]
MAKDETIAETSPEGTDAPASVLEGQPKEEGKSQEEAVSQQQPADGLPPDVVGDERTSEEKSRETSPSEGASGMHQAEGGSKIEGPDKATVEEEKTGGETAEKSKDKDPEPSTIEERYGEKPSEQQTSESMELKEITPATPKEDEGGFVVLEDARPNEGSTEEMSNEANPESEKAEQDKPLEVATNTDVAPTGDTEACLDRGGYIALPRKIGSTSAVAIKSAGDVEDTKQPLSQAGDPRAPSPAPSSKAESVKNKEPSIKITRSERTPSTRSVKSDKADGVKSSSGGRRPSSRLETPKSGIADGIKTASTVAASLHAADELKPSESPGPASSDDKARSVRSERPSSRTRTNSRPSNSRRGSEVEERPHYRMRDKPIIERSSSHKSKPRSLGEEASRASSNRRHSSFAAGAAEATAPATEASLRDRSGRGSSRYAESIDSGGAGGGSRTGSSSGSKSGTVTDNRSAAIKGVNGISFRPAVRRKVHRGGEDRGF